MMSAPCVRGSRPAGGSNSPVKVLLVDDNPGFLAVAAGFLSEHGALDVVGLAGSGGEALRRLNELEPDLVLMDLSMPEVNGLEITRQIKARPRPPQVIILTLYEGAEIRSLAQAAGADHFLTKSDFGDALLPLIDRMFPADAGWPAGVDRGAVELPAGVVAMSALESGPAGLDRRETRLEMLAHDRRGGGET